MIVYTAKADAMLFSTLNMTFRPFRKEPWKFRRVEGGRVLLRRGTIQSYFLPQCCLFVGFKAAMVNKCTAVGTVKVEKREAMSFENILL